MKEMNKMGKKLLVITGSPRKKGNSDLLADALIEVSYALLLCPHANPNSIITTIIKTVDKTKNKCYYLIKKILLIIYIKTIKKVLLSSKENSPDYL